jgi:membrane-associated protease RseP (regulator of RpoE activity)
MTLTHHSPLIAALLGAALISCAGSSAREDNQAPPAPQPRFARGPDMPPPPPDTPPMGAPRWRQPGDGPQGYAPRVRIQGAPGRSAPRLVSPDHQDGPVLGVNVEKSNDGLRVKEVLETSLANSAGIKVDDVLLRVGDEHIDNVADVRRALAGKRPGDQVKLAVIRAGEGIVELTGTVPEPPADAQDQGEDEHDHAMRGDGSRGGFLGVQLAETDEAGAKPDADQAAAPQAPGILIEGVVPNSAAWFAGLDAKDRLLAIDGKTLTSAADLVGAVASKEPGSLVELKYVRDGQEHTTSVRLGRRGTAMNLLGKLDDLHGLKLEAMPGMDFSQLDPDHMQFQMLQPFGDDDMQQLFQNLQLQPGADSRSVRIEIDGDRMDVERDGQTEHYIRGADGSWQAEDGSAATSSDPSKA